ncbi:MAG: response regulator [Acidobacteria bacterium]|nr:response regulator [Acidobacteriota bacterium]
MTWSTSSTVGAASADVLPELGSILLVEDEPDLADLVSSRLRTENFAVAVASSVSSALHSLKGISFDLVLLDVHLPDGSGLEVLQSLATDPDAPRVVLMTGSGTSETVLDAIRYRAQEFIRKPFTLDELVDVVGRSVKAAREEIEVISCTPEWLEVLASCTRESAARIEAFVSHLASDLSTDVRIQIGQVFRELLLNAVEWGGGLNPNHRVRVAYVRGKRSIQYRIADPGLGFSFRELAHSALSATTDDPLSYVAVRERQGIRPGGLGILMARAMADELIYNEQQNEVLFIKYL